MSRQYAQKKIYIASKLSLYSLEHIQSKVQSRRDRLSIILQFVNLSSPSDLRHRCVVEEELDCEVPVDTGVNPGLFGVQLKDKSERKDVLGVLILPGSQSVGLRGVKPELKRTGDRSGEIPGLPKLYWRKSNERLCPNGEESDAVNPSARASACLFGEQGVWLQELIAAKVDCRLFLSGV